MAMSIFLRSSLTRGSSLKALSNQLIRASSVYTTGTIQTSPQNLSQPKTNFRAPSLLAPTNNYSKILAKYFAATKTLQSSDGKGHDHVKIWTLERILSISLLPLIPAALIAPNQLLDTLVAVIIVMHTHWGLEACVVDYVRPILFGEIGPKIGMGLLYLFSAITLAGCFNLIFNDVGLANAFREIWKL